MKLLCLKCKRSGVEFVRGAWLCRLHAEIARRLAAQGADKR